MELSDIATYILIVLGYLGYLFSTASEYLRAIVSE